MRNKNKHAKQATEIDESRQENREKTNKKTTDQQAAL